MLVDYPQSLTNAYILGQGNLNMVREKSGKSQGILLSIICGNPVLDDKFWVLDDSGKGQHTQTSQKMIT